MNHRYTFSIAPKEYRDRRYAGIPRVDWCVELLTRVAGSGRGPC